MKTKDVAGNSLDSSTLQSTMNGGETPSAKRIKLDNSTSFVTPRSITEKQKSSETFPTPLSQSKAQELFERETKQETTPSTTKKRTDYLTWDDYFMSVVLLSAKRSKDPTTPTGACIVNEDNLIVGIGYNGFPRNCSDNVLPWHDANHTKKEKDGTPWLHTRDPYVCHAEINAILNKCSANVKGTRLYVQHYPCNECAKVILQSGIREVVFMKDIHHEEEEYMASRIMFAMAGVKTRKYSPTRNLVTLNFVHSMAPTSGQETPPPQQSESKLDPDKMRFFQQLLACEVGDSYDMAKAPMMKRQDYMSWDDYFMAMAFLTAQRSKDPNTQVGACIVDSKKRIIGVGYNGFPRGCSDNVLPWSRSSPSNLLTKYMYVCHAEVNAILNKCTAHVEGASLYVALFPCNECAKFIIQSGIKEVVYLSDQYHDVDCCRASRIMLQMANVTTRQYVPSEQVIEIEFQKKSDQE